MVVKLLSLQGELFVYTFNPGRCPGLGASALSGRIGDFQLILQGVWGALNNLRYLRNLRDFHVRI